MLTIRHILIMTFCVGFASLMLAWAAEHIFGLQPCVLCMYQRYITMGVTVLAGLGAFILPGNIRTQILVICGALLLMEAGVAFYQVGIEEHWFKLPYICTGKLASAETIEGLHAQLMGISPVACDQVSFRLFGVSLAGYNFLLSVLLATLCLTRPLFKSRDGFFDSSPIQ